MWVFVVKTFVCDWGNRELRRLELECHSLILMPSVSMNLPSLDGYSNLEWLGEG